MIQEILIKEKPIFALHSHPREHWVKEKPFSEAWTKMIRDSMKTPNDTFVSFKDDNYIWLMQLEHHHDKILAFNMSFHKI